MFKNYFLVVWRNLYRHPVFALINIVGLTLGIGFAILVMQYVSYESSYDRQYDKAGNTYRIVSGFQWVRGSENYNLFMPATLAEMKDKVQEVKYVATYTAPREYEVETEQQPFKEPVSFVNTDFFNIFNVGFLRGDPATAMDVPFTVVITESLAKKYFNSLDVVGRNLKLDGEKDFTITGVISDFKKNTHIANGLFASHNSKAWRGFASDANATPYSYMLSVYLQFSGGDPDTLIKRIDENYQAEMKQRAESGSWGGFNADDLNSLSLQALTDIHFSQPQHVVRQVEDGEPKETPITYGMTTAIALGLAILVLGISCCNYIYLSIARTSQRSKEIAMRKVTGASRKQLFGQFICESLLITLIASLFALLLAWALRPLVAGFAGVDEAVFGFANLRFLAVMGGLVTTTAVLAGLYPALVLSGISPLQALLGSGGGAMGQVKLRRILVVSQFAVTALLLMVTFFIFQQLAWLENTDMGFETDNVVVISPQSRIRGRENYSGAADALREELLQSPEITAMAISDGGPLDFRGRASMEAKLPSQGDDEFAEFNSMGVDDNFGELYRPRLLAGRYLDAKNYPADLTKRERWTITTGGSMVLTRAALKELKVNNPKEIIGKELDVKITGFRGWGASDDLKSFTVVGVIDDFNVGTGSSAIIPHALVTSYSYPGYLALRTTGRDNQAAMQAVTAGIAKIFPDVTFNINFLQDLYQRENAPLIKLGNGFSIVTLISVFISCLGLYAIASFTVERRTKEVGVRKAIGASVASIVRMLIWDFTKPILISILLAVPVAIWSIYTILQYMPNHAPVGFAIYIEVVLVVIVIAWLTVSSHTFRTAVDNPTKSLRYE